MEERAKRVIKVMNDELKVKIISGIDHRSPIDPEEDFFEIGLVRVKGLLQPDSLELTEAGEKALHEIVTKQLAEKPK